MGTCTWKTMVSTSPSLSDRGTLRRARACPSPGRGAGVVGAVRMRRAKGAEGPATRGPLISALWPEVQEVRSSGSRESSPEGTAQGTAIRGRRGSGGGGEEGEVEGEANGRSRWGESRQRGC